MPDLADLMKLGWDHCVLNQKLEGHDLQSGFVCSLENDGARRSGLLNLEPAGRTDTPAVARLEACEAVLGHRRAQVVAEGL